MGRVKKILQPIGAGIVMLCCGLISVFLLASGYESLYNRSLPFIPTIEPVDLTALGISYKLNDAVVHDEKMYGNYGKPATVKLPERSARLDIVPPIKDTDGSWLGRANTLHLLVPAKPRGGNLGLAVLYCRAGYRTFNAETLPKIGANIFIDTDHSWRYVYKVTSTAVAPAAQPYVVADAGTSSRLLLGCYDANTKHNAYIEATLLSVQGIET